MNLSLTPELEQLVQHKVESGRYNSPGEVVREALHLLERDDEVRSIQLQELHARIDKSVCELDRGESVDGETFMQELIGGLEKRHAMRKVG